MTSGPVLIYTVLAPFFVLVLRFSLFEQKSLYEVGIFLTAGRQIWYKYIIVIHSF